MICTGCRKFKTTQRKYFFAGADMNTSVHVRPLPDAFHWLPVKERIIFKTVTFVLCVFLWYPAIVSLCVHSFSDWPFQFRWENFPVQDGKLRAMGFGYRSFSETFLLTSDTAVLSHSLKLLLKPFSLLLPTLSYSNPLTGIGSRS